MNVIVDREDRPEGERIAILVPKGTISFRFDGMTRFFLTKKDADQLARQLEATLLDMEIEETQ